MAPIRLTVRLVAAALLTLALAPRAAEAAPGDLDASFGGTGIVSTPIASPAYGAAEAVAVQPDGKVVVAGRRCADEACDFALLRYNTDGTPDTSFSGDGLQTTGFAQSSAAYAVATAPDDRIVVAGTVPGHELSSYDVAGFQGGGDYGAFDPSTDLRGRVRPKRARRNRLRFTVAGRIRLPDGLPAADGCTGRVTVKIRVIRKGPDKVISRRLTHIRDDCTYRSTARLTAKRLKRHRGTLRFAIRFQGNERLRPRQIVRKAKFDRRA